EDAKTQGELVSKLTKERDEAITNSETLTQEKAALEEDVNVLQGSVAVQYEEGFQFALEQMRVLFPDLDEKRLGEADALKKIEDGKLVSYVPPLIVILPSSSSINCFWGLYAVTLYLCFEQSAPLWLI
ncbi:hypothetical protein A2U01_0051009, partial [Trifolium medium]|nr:hypothetical protein [Trifolium medium]